MDALRFYLLLQFSRCNRFWREAEVHPVVGYILTLIAFILFSNIFFHKIEDAQYFYSLVGVSILFHLMERTRILHLRSIFQNNCFYVLRLFENLIFTIPFMIYLIFEGKSVFAAALLLGALLMVFVKMPSKAQFVLPTPYRKFPFEYIIGFRKYILLFLLAYFLLYKSVEVQNLNLGIASISLVFLICLSFYFYPERIYHVWMFSSDAKGFLYKKVKDSFFCSSILIVPMIVVLSFTFWEESWILLLVLILGYFFLITIILAKYSAYPKEMNLPQALLIGLSLWFPPMLLFVLPIFYKKSLKKLNQILQ